MRKRDLEKMFQKKGWKFLRHGGNHDIWTNGKVKEQIPRHPEIAEPLAKALIRKHIL